MKRIFLVRHGQASFGHDHYDQLSTNGEQQAKLLAQSWQQIKLQPCAWLSGTLQRQKHTLDIIQRDIGANSNSIQMNCFDEFPAEAITEHYLPLVVAKKNDPSLTREKIFSDNLIFQKLFGEVLKLWITESTPENFDFESFAGFSERVNQAMTQLKSHEFKDSLAVFTSAGCIAAICYQIINNNRQLDMQMFKIAWNIINSSVTELRLNKGQLYLHSLNQYAHLNLNPNLITYR
ncbi:histidine phosphatase family protein [Kangiella sp. HZ709]|uniref:histidine phosphatase family protein n=1 Tax=Kangiella sp. HZ709 TaxID=2666328 RepID=UPI0012B06EBB|nr:histidine phosphatase family protein [Kangiella sp. HZ709]MRX27248.1 hypothetical protein [Kangiella sp. HZ709]